MLKANIVVHQLDQPRWEINYPFGAEKTLNISYHNNDHYSSLKPLTQTNNNNNTTNNSNNNNNNTNNNNSTANYKKGNNYQKNKHPKQQKQERKTIFLFY